MSCQSNYPSPLEEVTCYIDSLWQEGVLWINSTGNMGAVEWPGYPDTLDRVQAVTALFDDDYIASTADGPNVDFSARGSLVQTLDLSGESGTDETSDYTDLTFGSSMAAPVVAGIAALVYSRRPDLVPRNGPPVTLLAVLDSSFEDQVGPPEADSVGRDWFYGKGRANAFRPLVAVTRGDVNSDGVVSIIDVVRIVREAFSSGGDSLTALHYGLYDLDCSGVVSVVDVVRVVNMAWRGHDYYSPCYRFDY